MKATASTTSPPAATASGSLWKNSIFAKMFFAYSLSTFGDWFDILAISVLIGYVWHADPMVISLVPIAFAVPGILFGQYAGHLADHGNKLRILILCDLAACVLTVGLVFAPNLPTLLVLLLLRSAARVFNFPSQQALTRHAVAPEHLLQASSYNGGVNQFGKTLGPLLGAAALGYFSPQVCLWINAVSFLLSAVILSSIGKVREAAPVQTESKAVEKRPFSESWKEGWRIIFQNRALFATIAFTYFGYFILQFVDFQFPVIYRDYAPDLPQLLAWGMAAIGLGSILSITFLGRLKEIKRYGLVLGMGLVLSSGLLLLMGLLRPSMPVWLVLAFCFIGGLGSGLKITGGNYLIQKETPPEAMGRVAGITNLLGSTVIVVSPLLGGLLINRLGASPMFFAVGAIMLALGLVGLLFGKQLFGKR